MSRRLVELARARLAADAGVTALVSARLFPNKLPQATTLPAVVLSVISDVPSESLDGFVGLRRARLQVDAYDRTYDGAQALADAIFAVLGDVATPDFASLQGQRRDLYEDQSTNHRASQDFIIWTRE